MNDMENMNDGTVFDADTQKKIDDGKIIHLGGGWFKGTNPKYSIGGRAEWAKQQEAQKTLDSQTDEENSNA